MKTFIAATLIAAGSLAATSATARDLDVTVTNLTNGMYFTPLLIATHPEHTHLFQVGMPASRHLQAMAEGGAIAGLSNDVTAMGGTVAENPAGGLLAPGASTTATLDVRGRDNRYLSVVAMMLPTNDGFIGLNGIEIPKQRGTYTYYLNGYDAGTEANDEIVVGGQGGVSGVPGIPAAPGGQGGSGATGAAGPDKNTTVHVHRGTLGDMDPSGGFSDLDSRVHHWLNPVARVIVTVK